MRASRRTKAALRSRWCRWSRRRTGRSQPLQPSQPNSIFPDPVAGDRRAVSRKPGPCGAPMRRQPTRQTPLTAWQQAPRHSDPANHLILGAAAAPSCGGVSAIARLQPRRRRLWAASPTGAGSGCTNVRLRPLSSPSGIFGFVPPLWCAGPRALEQRSGAEQPAFPAILTRIRRQPRRPLRFTPSFARQCRTGNPPAPASSAGNRSRCRTAATARIPRPRRTAPIAKADGR